MMIRRNKVLMRNIRTNQRTMTVKGENAETSARQKRSICYFLLSLLEDESYPHVKWTDKAKGEFKIHWMHASSGTWEMETDAETFRLWAKAKGKLEGRENNYKTWKANFRCAMKSRHELEEIKLPGRKKNLKFWKFNNMKLVNKYKDGEKFEWNRPQTQPSSKKSGRVLRVKRKKRAPVDTDDNTEEETHQSPDFCGSQSTSTHTISNGIAVESSYETEEFLDEQLAQDRENDDFYSYGAELLDILERRDNDSVVPNLSLDSSNLFPIRQEPTTQTESSVFHECTQLPPFHQISGSLSKGQSSFSDVLLEQDWEFYGDEDKELKEGISARCFDISSNDIRNDDPFFCENIYMQL